MKLYDPFKEFTFDSKSCFLTGKTLSSPEERIQVIPTWLMQEFDLEAKPLKMLDERIVTYKQLTLPCHTDTAEIIYQLEDQVKEAFLGGYEQVSKLDSLVLFQWIAKLVYGMVFVEVQAGVRQQMVNGESMNFSQVLAHKFKNLHLMLQSLIVPMQFDGNRPYTIQVVRVDNPQDFFNYRDEINTLVFSMRMGDFGIIACLQDNGTNGIYNDEFLSKTKDQVLHPIQFEELCGRFFYSAYLFNRLPEYTVLQTPDKVYVEPMSLVEMAMKPIFDSWQVKVFGQVLENFWKPWGYTLFEIIKDPEHPMSFLMDREEAFISKEMIDLSITGLDGQNEQE